MLGEKLGTKIVGLLQCGGHPSSWVHWRSRRGDVSKWKSYLQTGNSDTVILKPAGQPPAAPPLFAQAEAPSGPEPASSRPEQRGAGQAPRARHLAARGAPGGRLIPLQPGSLHFQGRESNNERIGAAARVPFSLVPSPACPTPLWPGIAAPGPATPLPCALPGRGAE